MSNPTINSAYTPIPSAFTCVEKPLRYVYDLYDPPHAGARGMYLAGMIVYPLVVCAAPVTMVADMMIGVAECAFCTLRGDSLRDIAALAKKKIIISPLHHLIFVTTSLASSARVIVLLNYNVLSAKFWLVLFTTFVWGISTPLIREEELAHEMHLLSIEPTRPLAKLLFENRMLHISMQISIVVKASWDFIPLLFAGKLTVLKLVIPIVITSLYWTYNYTFSQRLIGSFSASWNHQTLSIFRDRGAPVKFVGSRYFEDGPQNPTTTFQDLAFTDCSIAFWEAHSPAKWKAFWTNFLGDDRGKINPSNAHGNTLYSQFRNDVLADKPAIEILKLPQNPLKSDILEAYKTYSLVLHPDKNPTRFDEATVLFNCLAKAKSQLIDD